MLKKGISLLIPTFNRPGFLERALLSVVNQTRLPDEILIYDDNPSSIENFKIVKKFKEKYPTIIKYKKNKTNLGVVANYLKLLEDADYEYIKFLADDDFLHPKALELMEKALDENPDVGLVSSRRLAVTMEGEILNIESTKPLVFTTSILYGRNVIKTSIINLLNFVGEFSTYMFRKSLLDINPFKFCGLKFRANADWVLWMYILSKSNLFYYANPLSLFAIHERQDQLSIDVKISGIRERMELSFNKNLHSIFGIRLTYHEAAKIFERLIKDLTGFGYSVITESFYSIEISLLQELEEELKHKYKGYIALENLEVENIKEEVEPFSIIIVTFNSSSTIDYLLNSIKSSIGRKDEIIIIDNNSVDDTVEKVRSFIRNNPNLNVKFIQKSQNVGYSQAINEGVLLSSNEFLLFVNPDTILPKEWKKKVYDALKDKNVGAVGPISNCVLNFQHLSRFSNISRVLKDGKELKKSVNFINIHLQNLYSENPAEETNFLVGFFLATKKSVFKEVNGFDSSLFLGADDLDYSLKLREKGYKLLILKNLYIYHEGHVSFKKNPKSESLNQTSINRFADKLIAKYGYGNVPNPEKLWGTTETKFFRVFVPKGSKYKFMFKFSERNINYKDVGRKLRSRPKIGIITVTHFSSKDIELLAKTLSRSTYDNFLWFLIDHSEDSEEFNLLKKNILKYHPSDKVKLFKRENLGYAAGNNYGIRKALEKNCEYVWVLNPDIELSPNTAFELLKTLLYTGADVVTCKMKDSIYRNKLQYDGLRVSYDPFSDYPQRIHEVAFLSGANFFIKAEIFNEIKFREDFFMYFEDNDFFDKLKEKKKVVLYTPFTFVYHKHKKFLSKPLEVYYYFRNLLIYSSDKGKEIEFRSLLSFYKKKFHDKSLLRALILAIHDGILRRTGKIFNGSLIIQRKQKKQLLESYLTLRRISKRLALEKGRDYLLINPRDYEIFLKYLLDARLYWKSLKEEMEWKESVF